ncbi:unnamed protein product [Spirodela intermedia]|uniref:Nucleolus and neural progenitor protein-like N-terminal domain-containing protein n=1 Tax=Spirodela intermedia TaxID=51605 RepID=A0A7I8IMC7_SPIIN|nr:unnamed protein product [Spirodela intermedia]CAA6658295.1 unnamed protein product [Spirodela intermedia]
MVSDGCPSTEEEGRLKAFLVHLRIEASILDRMVRRDVQLLLSARLEDILTSTSQVIHGRNPAQRIYLLERLKNRTLRGTNNFHERLLGVARLLSQIVEAILRAATQISSLLAKSFFMGFSLTILSLLARLRVLVQQVISSLSQERHSVNLTKNGIEAFREYYPPSGPIISLECAWERDKFVLIEREHFNNRDEKDFGVASLEAPDMQYEVLGFESEVSIIIIKNVYSSFVTVSCLELDLFLRAELYLFTSEDAGDHQDPENITTKPLGEVPCEVDPQIAGIPVSTPKLINDPSLKRKVAFVSVTRTSEESKIRRDKKPRLDDMPSSNPQTGDSKDPFLICSLP